MKVQIFEQFLGGHHTTYIAALLPSLVQLLEAGQIEQVIVTITREHLTSAPFRQQLAQFVDRVQFEPSLPLVHHKVTTQGRFQIARNLLASAQRIQPDYLIATSADQESLFLALRSRLGLPTLPKHTHSIGIIHAGCPDLAIRRSDLFKDQVYRFSWQHAPWSRLLPVNPLVFDWIRQHNGPLAQRTRLLPDPVPPVQVLSKRAARELLNLPLDGRYVGYVGMMDERKAIPELLSAFRAATSSPTDRLLLAGFVLPAYKTLIQARYADLLETGRLVMLDRYLTLDEVAAGFQALDLAAILHYPRPALSANLLKAIAFDRPVVVDAFGYTGMMAQQFDIGQACSVYDHPALVAALKQGLERSASYRMTAPTRRLLEFHQPENFANTVLSDLYARTLPDRVPSLKTWDWVTESNVLSLPGLAA